MKWVSIRSSIAIMALSGTSFLILNSRLEAHGPIQPLTFKSLKVAFPDNFRFLGLVASRIEDDRELAQYDKSNQTFAVNRLLLESREQ